MNMINQLIIEGNVRNPEYRELPGGKKILSFVLAHERSYTSTHGPMKENYLFEVEMYGNAAEALKGCLWENRGVRLVGRLKQVRWEGYGETSSRTFVVAEHIDLKPVGKHDSADLFPEMQRGGKR